MRLYAFTCGWLTAPASLFLRGESGRLRVPVPCFLIDHPKGKVLFDSGLHPSIRENPEARLGDAARAFQVECGPGDGIAAQLRAFDVDPGSIDYLINSHLHFDHAGGNATLPNARVVVQRDEWLAGGDPDQAAANGFNPKDYDTGQDVILLKGLSDLFGDGRILCLPTAGHTPGHQSLRLRLDGGDVLLAADACQLRRTLDELILPGTLSDPQAMLATLHRLRGLQRAGLRIVYGHDPDFWATVPQAPASLGRALRPAV